MNLVEGDLGNFLRCAFYLFIRVMEITDIVSQNVPLEDVQYLAGHSNPSGHTEFYDRCFRHQVLVR